MSRMLGSVMLMAALFLVATAIPSHAEQPCVLKSQASVDIETTQNGDVTIPVSISGTPFRMLVDTGAYSSVLTEGTVEKLGMQPIQNGVGYLVMFGGQKLDSHVTVSDFKVGRMNDSRASFMVMPDALLDPGVAGLFGTDFVYFFDLDFDFANAKLNFISPEHCKGQVVYWTHEAYATIPFDLKRRHISIDTTLDGKKVSAIVDTGTTESILNLETAVELFGVDREAAKKSDYRYPFKLLSFGGVNVMNPAIHLVSGDASAAIRHEQKMILGMDALRQLHLYIAYHEGNIYVTSASAH